MDASERAVIQAALDELPSRCRYHGEDIDPHRIGYGREAGGDTGRPAMRRRRAEAALRKSEPV